MERRPTGTGRLELRIFPHHRILVWTHNGLEVLNDIIFTPPWTLLFEGFPGHWLLESAFYYHCFFEVAMRFRLNFRPPDPNTTQRMITRALQMNFSMVVEFDHFGDDHDEIFAVESVGASVQSGLPNLDSIQVLDDVDLAPTCCGGGSRSAIEKLIKKGCFVADKSDQELLGTCSICLEELSSPEGAELLRMDCSHLYHQGCILPWLEKRNTCPTCRREVDQD